MNRVCLSAFVPLLCLVCIGTVRASAPKTLLVIEPTREHPRNSEGDIIALKDGSLLLAYTRFYGGRADDAAAEICARMSRDAGRTWSPDRVLVPCEGKANVMSVSLLRLKTGELLLFYLRKNDWSDCNMFVRRSGDELATVSEPVRVTTRPGYYVINNARVAQLASGRIVVPAVLHPCPDGTSRTWSPYGIPVAFLSDDGGRTWLAGDAPGEPPLGKKVMLQEPGVLESRDRGLWMWLRTNAGAQYACESRDAGKSWSLPRPTNLVSPTSPASIKRVPWSGDLLAVWNDHSGSRAPLGEKRSPLVAALSKDEGRTWSPSQVIESDPDGWYCYTSITFVGDETILSYCAGDKRVGGLNRLKVVSLCREWLYPASKPASGAGGND